MEENQSWTSEFRLSFRNLKELYGFLGWPVSRELEKVAKLYPVFIPRKLAQKIKDQGPGGILAREFLPALPELNSSGMEDPIGDKKHFKAPQLIHRYRSRALFTPTTLCPVNCRYCFRKNELSAGEELFQQDFEKTLRYLTDHPEISEVIFTGGDPLNLSTEKLEKYLMSFSEISSIRDIRFHTRFPVIMPERIDEDFLNLLKRAARKFRTISLAIHANHIQEFDASVNEAIEKLRVTGIQLLSQTVLLKGVNDSKDALLQLMNHFIDLKIRPYYLHHPDQVKGGLHFYLTLEEGRKIYHELRSELPGWAIPLYVIDVPGGHGKISAFNPEGMNFSGKVMSLEGKPLEITEPD